MAEINYRCHEFNKFDIADDAVGVIHSCRTVCTPMDEKTKFGLLVPALGWDGLGVCVLELGMPICSQARCGYRL
jgi:hypothetical protein